MEPAQILRAQRLDNGPVWLSLQLDSADTVLALEPDHAQLAKLGRKVGVAGVYQAPAATHLISRASREARAFSGNGAQVADADVEVRVWFDTGSTLSEDPITGSFNASLAQWLLDGGHIEAPYTASQGVNMDRAGRVHITQDASGQVWVGGQVTTAISGTVRL